MAGHNKWSKIKHRKKIVDGRRSKVWTKCVRAIMVAAKMGGGDPDHNISLRFAIDEARYANVPKDTIERAIKKGAGELTGDSFETIRYEGYGPGGVAIVVDALTDNRTRTAADVRDAFSKHGGNLGTSGCVGFLFDSRGQIVLAEAQEEPASSSKRRAGGGAAGGGGSGDQTALLSADRVMEVALEAGALDVIERVVDAEGAQVSPWIILTEPTALLTVKDVIEKAGFKVEEASVQMIPQNTVNVSAEQAESVVDLIDALEDLDDVQKVYANLADG